MSLDIVGTENLPNVYIKEISIEALDEYKLIANPIVYLKDIRANSRYQWYDNENLKKSLKVFIVISSSQAFNDVIASGTYAGGLTPKHIKSIPGYNSDLVDYKVVPLSALGKGASKSEEPIAGGTLCTFAYRCRFTIRTSSNMAVFACCMLDTEQFSAEQDLDLNHPLINSYYGAIAGEYIIRNNKVEYNSKLFFNGDTLWTGPVHKVGGTFFAGSKPGPSVRELTMRAIPNTKIKDYRIVLNKKPRVLRDIPQNTSIFSKLYPSFNANGNLTGTFYMNMRQFFTQKTRYGGLLLQLNEQTFSAMMTKIKIKRFDIYRDQVLVSQMPSSIGTTKLVANKSFNKTLLISSHDETPYSLRTKYRYYSSKNSRDRMLYNRITGDQAKTETLKSLIKEAHVENSLETRVFTFSDLMNTYNSLGHFRYSVVMELNDPTYEYVREMLLEIKASYNRYKTYKRKIEKTMYYDYNTHRTKEAYIQTQQNTEWLTFIDTYVKYYDLLFEADSTQINELSKQLISWINPRSATIRSMDRFAQHYDFLYNYFMEFFGQSNRLFNDPTSRGNVKINANRGKIQVDNLFSEILSFSQNQRRLSFLPDEFSSQDAENFPTLSRSLYKSLVATQRDKYFRTTPQFTQSRIPAFNDSLVDSMNKIEMYSSTHLSPRRLFLKDRDYKVTNLETLDIASFNKFYSSFVDFENKSYEHYSDASSLEVARANRNLSSFYIRKPSAVQKNEQEQETYSAEDVLGSESSFVPAPPPILSLQNTRIEPLVSQMFGHFHSSYSNSLTVSTSYYSLKGSGTIISSLVNSPKFNEEVLKMMPLQIKSLLGSNYDFSRTNVLNANSDLIVNPLTSDLVRVLFFTIAKVEYLDGFERSNEGELQLSRPIWKLLTMEAIDAIDTSVLCKMTFYANDNFKIATPSMSSYNIENAHFFLGRGTRTDSLGAIDPLSMNQSTLPAIYSDIIEVNTYPLEYARSLIVTQTNDKNGPLKSLEFVAANQPTPAPPASSLQGTAPTQQGPAQTARSSSPISAGRGGRRGGY